MLWSRVLVIMQCTLEEKVIKVSWVLKFRRDWRLIIVVHSTFCGAFKFWRIFFCWRIFLIRLATKDQLIKIGLIFSINGETCVLCSQAEEDFNYLLFDCPISSKVWDSMGVWSGCYVSFVGVSWKHFLAWCGMFNNHTRSVKVGLIWLLVIWCLWKVINDIIFNDDLCNLNDII